MPNRISKILYYVMVYFMFLVSDAQLMEELKDPNEQGFGHFSSSEEEVEKPVKVSPLLSLSEEEQKTAKLLAKISFDESRKPSTAHWVVGGGLSIGAIFFSAIVFAAFANLAIYLFVDGIPTDNGNSTCTDNTTSSPHPAYGSNFSAQQLTDWPSWIADWAYTAGLALVPATAGIVASMNDGGSLVIDKCRSARKWIREYRWSSSSHNESSNDPLSIQDGQEEAPSRCACIPKRFRSLQYWTRSWSVEAWETLGWCLYFDNFIITTFIKNYSDDPIRAKVYGAIFSTAANVLVYYLFNHLTGVADKNPLHKMGDIQCNGRIVVKTVRKMMDNQEQKTQEQKTQEQKTQEQRTDEMRALVRCMNSGSGAQLSDLEDAWARVWPQLDAQLLDNYGLKEEKRIRFAQWGSLGIQGVIFPLKVFAQGAQVYKLGWLLGVSPDDAFKAALLIPGLGLPLSILGSLGAGRSLVQYELYQVPQYFSLPRSAYAAAMRVGNVASVGSNILYLAIPTWFFYYRDIFFNYYCNDYFLSDYRVRAGLAAVFCAGVVWCAGRQFFDRQYERMISGAFASTCCASDSAKESGSLTVKEEKDWRRNVERLLYLLGKNKYDELPKTQGEASGLL